MSVYELSFAALTISGECQQYNFSAASGVTNSFDNNENYNIITPFDQEVEMTDAPSTAVKVYNPFEAPSLANNPFAPTAADSYNRFVIPRCGNDITMEDFSHFISREAPHAGAAGRGNNMRGNNMRNNNSQRSSVPQPQNLRVQNPQAQQLQPPRAQNELPTFLGRYKIELPSNNAAASALGNKPIRNSPRRRNRNGRHRSFTHISNRQGSY
jgi:hypothetical protein